ncbi:hypothetical protein J5X84_41690 [Streptosporangiaceae bacterium NEAU-GS5]|nr:hypothetical protein [Streptosporangiaceae bacterium NEAU-GS5]
MFDRAPNRWWERDQRDAIALADYPQDAMAVFFAQVLNARSSGLEDP